MVDIFCGHTTGNDTLTKLKWCRHSGMQSTGMACYNYIAPASVLILSQMLVSIHAAGMYY